MNVLERYDLGELKLVYRVLHAQLPDHMELMDSALLHDLQTLLQGKARQEGVDISLHEAWATWLSA